LRRGRLRSGPESAATNPVLVDERAVPVEAGSALHRPQSGRDRRSHGPGPRFAPRPGPSSQCHRPVRGLLRPALGQRLQQLMGGPGGRARRRAGRPGRHYGPFHRFGLAGQPTTPKCGQAHAPQPFRTALATVLLSPSVTLLFGLAALPVSWLFLAAVPAALFVAFIIHPAAVSGDWWQRLVAPRAVGCVALSFLVLSLEAAAIDAAPSAL